MCLKMPTTTSNNMETGGGQEGTPGVPPGSRVPEKEPLVSVDVVEDEPEASEGVKVFNNEDEINEENEIEENKEEDKSGLLNELESKTEAPRQETTGLSSKLNVLIFKVSKFRRLEKALLSVTFFERFCQKL